MLQRGRAPESAESITRWKPAGRWNGFNGAALRRARSRREGIGPVVKVSQLQRGRAPESAESSLWWIAAEQKPNASTGPRSGERGVVCEVTSGRVVASVLQRGRAPESAESFRLVIARIGGIRLQRGRAPESAESPAR